MVYPGRVSLPPRTTVGPKALPPPGPTPARASLIARGGRRRVGAYLTGRTHRLHGVFTPRADAPSVRNVIRPLEETRSIDVIVVRSPACHLCEDAIEALAEIGTTFPLDVRVVEIDSEDGRAIIARYRPALSPAVVIDGRLFSAGRLPRRKLRRTLERMT